MLRLLCTVPTLKSLNQQSAGSLINRPRLCALSDLKPSWSQVEADVQGTETGSVPKQQAGTSLPEAPVFSLIFLQNQSAPPFISYSIAHLPRVTVQVDTDQ